MEMLKTKTVELKSKRKNFKIWLLLSIVGLYPLYYYFTHLPDQLTFENLFLEKFQDKGLLLIIFLFPFTMFWINYLQKDRRVMRDFQYYLELDGNTLYLHTFATTYSLQKGKEGRKILFEDTDKSPLSLKADQIINIDERRRSGTTTNQQMSIPVQGSGTIGDKLNQPLELKKTTSTYDYMETFFEYEDGATQSFYAPYSIEEIKKFLKI